MTFFFLVLQNDTSMMHYLQNKIYLKCVILRLHGVFQCPYLNEMMIMESGRYDIIMSFPGGKKKVKSWQQSASPSS